MGRDWLRQVLPLQASKHDRTDHTLYVSISWRLTQYLITGLWVVASLDWGWVVQPATGMSSILQSEVANLFNSCATGSQLALCSVNRRLARYTADSALTPETGVVEHHCLKYGKLP